MPRNRRQTMRSFTWEPADGDELSSCPDCVHWHALFEVEDTQEQEFGATVVTVREWHEADCPDLVRDGRLMALARLVDELQEAHA